MARSSDRTRKDSSGRAPGQRPASSDPADPLAPLRVLERLEVGPVRVQANRLTAPYVVVRNGTEERTELAYRWQENVFAPNDAASKNLAAMVAAQVALNYGLFCDEIVFHGAYDSADRRFLKDMAENTAREIYVKKFLEPNPFLVGPATELPTVKRERYLHAKLVFPDIEEDPNTGNPGSPGLLFAPGDRARHLILSSGGKDSLLTFGLLRELGFETHPVFINESGRHWFTALNAYRHFDPQVPNTARVWTNADRVFSWMLRHFPFIRSDFQSLRSDEYPIRLWTVAVFLFGALPLALKRGVGRVIIGDEYDATERTSFKGITYYNGVYDQSRYFDNALSRYYVRKRWAVSQFSLLRPLSELLIEKMLVERYPDLLQLQVSCHAAHKEEGRVRPCGKCEKCRRIVGMIMALGGDPAACGYPKDRVTECLTALAAKGVHQEKDGVEHLMYMLRERGLLSVSNRMTQSPRPHPEIMQLRFDAERSPENWIPGDLRAHLLPIFLEHAQGSVRRSGKVWVEFDARTDPAMAAAYPFEKTSAGTASDAETLQRPGRSRALSQAAGESVKGPSAGPLDGKRRSFIWGELTWPEAQARLKEVDVAMLPVGAIEQHGPHLPLDTDAFDALYLAKQVAAACRDPKPFVLPLIPYGVSYHHDDFAGTLSVSNDAIATIAYDIGISAARNGITKLIIINGHGGNAASLHFAAQMINRDARIFTCVDTGETSDADIEGMANTRSDIHAGEIETSTTLATRPELVQMDKARKYVPRFSSSYLDFSSKRSIDWYARTAKISRSGVMGDPSRASKEKGERMWAVMIKNLVEFVEHLKSMSLDEIHQRNRY